MEKKVIALTNVAFWGAFGVSLINILAGVFGISDAVNWLLGSSLPVYLGLPLGLWLWAALVFSWINSKLSNSSGMLIYFANLLAAPFFYQRLGLPYGVGLAIAVFPYPFYLALNRLSDVLHAKARG